MYCRRAGLAQRRSRRSRQVLRRWGHHGHPNTLGGLRLFLSAPSHLKPTEMMAKNVNRWPAATRAFEAAKAKIAVPRGLPRPRSPNTPRYTRERPENTMPFLYGSLFLEYFADYTVTPQPSACSRVQPPSGTGITIFDDSAPCSCVMPHAQRAPS